MAGVRNRQKGMLVMPVSHHAVGSMWHMRCVGIEEGEYIYSSSRQVAGGGEPAVLLFHRHSVSHVRTYVCMVCRKTGRQACRHR